MTKAQTLDDLLAHNNFFDRLIASTRPGIKPRRRYCTVQMTRGLHSDMAKANGVDKMSALQLWLQNHNRKLTQDAIDEALMEYISHVEKQRDELLAAAEAIEIDAEECLDFDECTAMLVPIDTYHKLMEAIASVNEK